MNFNTHLERNKLAVISALSSDKSILIGEFIIILKNSASLLKTDDFNFWIDELQNINHSEVPMTKYAVVDAQKSWNEYKSSKTTFKNILLDTCENLFTYWQGDDLCSMQGQFYYYKDKNTNLVFKQSVFGYIEYVDRAIKKSTGTQFGIALISDLHGIVVVDDLY
ncbi:hypothetical protein I6E61_10330 [Psychrobacter sp. NZS113]|uniref:hypothetical protein n=1 Tax=Psychrobacter sp. NZS113 TaxID=2792045 RepID=UPI0018CDDC0D|nr:hypothetical protein [Psychrobacter sp. NZS113]MBH0096782.1 hypothetical protein [Psychrobacter sp. NZS113]